ncbi:PHP domain-containing protein [Streptomyces nigra]|uniref:PHP domain-containing protein n=1 Tax=Streptomyces nigra TaxID=1827580 RepID=UPI003825A64B
MVQRAAERGMTTLALADRDTVAGTVRFAAAAAAAGIRPVFGVDVAVAPLTPPVPASGRPRTPVRGGAHVIEPPLRVTLLAQNASGWARLCRVVSAAHAEADGAMPVVSWSTLGAHADQDLVVMLGPASEPVRALSGGRPDVAERLLAPWRELAGPGLRLEAVYLGRQGTGAGSLRLAARTVGLADQLDVPVVLTNAVRYADPEQHRLADVLDAARLLRPVDGRRLDGGERWLKDPAAMRATADRIVQGVGDGPGRAVRLLAETEATGQSCILTPADLGLGRPHFPEPSVVGATSERGAAMRLLRQRCEAGMVARSLDADPRAVRQLDYELEVIGRLGFEGYFLAVAQVVADTRALGIRVAARGSGAGSMVNHALFIATANPLEHHLLFERFLSERRTSLPDIDLDVESERRLEVYDAIIERFGRERTAVTGMPETYRARHALRDTGLALGIPPQVIGDIAKSFPHIRARDIRAALVELPELRHLASQAGRFGVLWELAEGLDALPRGYAMHPCGVIISNASLLDRLPVQPTPASYPMLQADKEDVEDLGLLKLDVLGVRMQSAMAHAVAEIRRTTGRQLDLDNPDHVDLNSRLAFEMIQASDTVGLFQLESPGQQDLVGRLQPRHMQDVIADISLFSARPGARRHASAVHRSPARRRTPLCAPGPGADPQRHVRRGDLARTDHRHPVENDRLRPCRRRRRPPRSRGPRTLAQRGGVVPSDGRRTRLHQGRAGRGVGDRRLLRRLRVLPSARGRVRRPRPAVRVAQGPPPGRPVRRPPRARSGHVAQPRDRRGCPPPRRTRAAGRRQSILRAEPGRTGRWPLGCAAGLLHRQGHQRGGDSSSRGRTALHRSAGPVAAGPALPASRATPDQRRCARPPCCGSHPAGSAAPGHRTAPAVASP